MNLRRSVVLVGIMGCGKSAIGVRLAEKLGIKFIDLDKEIERREKLSITEIFEKYNEAYFREIERDTLADIVDRDLCVLAAGGGAFINDEVRELISEKATSVYIRADYDVVLERVSRKHNRPLLEKGDKAKILKELMQKRCPIYEEAEIIVDSSSGVHDKVVNKIIEELNARY